MIGPFFGIRVSFSAPSRLPENLEGRRASVGDFGNGPGVGEASRRFQLKCRLPTDDLRDRSEIGSDFTGLNEDFSDRLACRRSSFGFGIFFPPTPNTCCRDPPCSINKPS
jgi:hypothetical protein